MTGAAVFSRRTMLCGSLGALAIPSAFAQSVDRGLPIWVPEAVPAPAGNYVDPDGTIRIVGTAIMRRMVEGLSARFAEANPGFRFRLDMKPGLMAIGAITHGMTPFAPMPREFTDAEGLPFRRIVGAEPIAIRAAHGSVVARDRTAVLAIYVNRANPIAGLTLGQAARIFTTGHPGGDLTHWGQLGLTGEWATRPIHPAGTPEDTGFGSFMVRERMGGYPLSPEVTIRAVSSEVMDVVDNDVGGICYCAVNFATQRTREVPIAERDGAPFIAATPADVMAGRYPYDRFVYFYLRRARSAAIEPWIRSYMALTLSRDGQAIVAADRDSFLPLSAGEAAAERTKLG